MRLDSRSVDDDGSFYLMNNFFVQIFHFVLILFFIHFIHITLQFLPSTFLLFLYFLCSIPNHFLFPSFFVFCYDNKKKLEQKYKGCAGIRTCCYIPVGTFDARWCKRTG